MSEVSRCPEHVSFAKWELGEFPSESWGQLGVGGSLKVADWGLLCDSGLFLSSWFHSHNRSPESSRKRFAPTSFLWPADCGSLKGKVLPGKD